ncbi:MAG: hypothetical protein LBC47_06440 [Tannerella sp.]|jgi:hypothetical protein|nr:hypothetical protein [Tannerella sp.]
MMNLKIWDWISSRKRLREENEFLRERINVLEKKEREMQILNVNLKRECDKDIATLNKKHTKAISTKERMIEGLQLRELQLKEEVIEKKQMIAGYYNKLLDSQREIKELHRRITQMEAENRQKKNK